MCKRCATGTIPEERASDGERHSVSEPDGGERDGLRGGFDWNRRFFMKAAGAGAAGGVALGAGTGTAAAEEYPGADRFISADGSNYASDTRTSADVAWIVMHVTEGTDQSAINWFQNPDADVSAHYVVSNYDHTQYPAGSVTQMVRHSDVAWHAGWTNGISIGIEHEWHPDEGSYISDDCYQASADLVNWLCDEFGIQTRYFLYDEAVCEQSSGFVGHTNAPSQSDCSATSPKSCPGPDWDADRYMEFIRGERTA
jgi:hypothetical protein